jgi:hypothetical protein
MIASRPEDNHLPDITTRNPMGTSQGVQLLDVAIVSSLKGSQLGILQSPSICAAAEPRR